MPIKTMTIQNTHEMNSTSIIEIMLPANVSYAEIARCENLTDIRIKSLEKCPGQCIIKFVSDNVRLTHDVIKTLSNCNYLKYVNLLCPNLTDNAIVSLASACPNLTDIILQSCHRITNESIKALSNCTQLLQIDFDQCQNLTDDGIKFLSNCSELLECFFFKMYTTGKRHC